MPRRVLAQMRAMRAMAEGLPATLELLADVSGRSLPALRRDAEREGWKLRTGTGDLDGRLRALAASALARLEAEVARAEVEGGRIDKSEIEAVTALLKGSDRLIDYLRPTGAANENQNKSNEDLAALIDRIDGRIVELARELARHLAADLVAGPACGVAAPLAAQGTGPEGAARARK